MVGRLFSMHQAACSTEKCLPSTLCTFTSMWGMRPLYLMGNSALNPLSVDSLKTYVHSVKIILSHFPIEQQPQIQISFHESPVYNWLKGRQLTQSIFQRRVTVNRRNWKCCYRLWISYKATMRWMPDLDHSPKHWSIWKTNSWPIQTSSLPHGGDVFHVTSLDICIKTSLGGLFLPMAYRMVG